MSTFRSACRVRPSTWSRRPSTHSLNRCTSNHVGCMSNRRCTPHPARCTSALARQGTPLHTKQSAPGNVPNGIAGHGGTITMIGTGTNLAGAIGIDRRGSLSTGDLRVQGSRNSVASGLLRCSWHRVSRLSAAAVTVPRGLSILASTWTVEASAVSRSSRAVPRPCRSAPVSPSNSMPASRWYGRCWSAEARSPGSGTTAFYAGVDITQTAVSESRIVIDTDAAYVLSAAVPLMLVATSTLDARLRGSPARRCRRRPADPQSSAWVAAKPSLATISHSVEDDRP